MFIQIYPRSLSSYTLFSFFTNRLFTIGYDFSFQDTYHFYQNLFSTSNCQRPVQFLRVVNFDSRVQRLSQNLPLFQYPISVADTSLHNLFSKRIRVTKSSLIELPNLELISGELDSNFLNVREPVSSARVRRFSAHSVQFPRYSRYPRSGPCSRPYFSRLELARSR